MHALLLIAHGSRRPQSNEEIRDLAARLAGMAGERFGLVIPAFLELAEPDIVAGVGRCAEAGASAVTAVPYFLSAGRHVATDIPDELEEARRRYPGLAIRQGDYLGLHETIPEVLLSLATDRVDTRAAPLGDRPSTGGKEESI